MTNTTKNILQRMILCALFALLIVPAALAYTIEGEMLKNNNGQLQQLSCLTNAGEVKGFTWYYFPVGASQWEYAAHTESGVNGNLRYLQSWATDFPSQGYIEFFSFDGQKKVTQTYVDGLTLNQSDIAAWKCVYGNKVAGTDFTFENEGEYVFKMKDSFTFDKPHVEVTYDEANKQYVCTLSGVNSPVTPYYVWKEDANTALGSNSLNLSESYTSKNHYYYFYF